MSATTDRVVFVQPYLPKYRVGFFDQLAARLGEHGLQTALLVGTPSAQQRAREDEARTRYVEVVRSCAIPIRGRSLRIKSIWSKIGEKDLIVAELAASALENFYLAAGDVPRLRSGGM